MTEPAKVYVDGSTTTVCCILPDGKVCIAPARLDGDIGGKVTNNQGEYLAVLYGIMKAMEVGYNRFCIFSDSQLVIHQIWGALDSKHPKGYKCRNPSLRLLLKDVLDFLGYNSTTAIGFLWISREENPAGKVLDRR